MRLKRLICAFLISCVTWTLSSCVGLPESSPVNSGQAINGSSDREAVAIEPNGPGESDDPRQIVEGFMQAQISADNNYGIAHQFLTKSAGQSWQPGSTRTVFGSASQISFTRPDVNTVALSVPIIGDLTADGRWERAKAGKTAALKFGISHTSLGWRISSLPPNLGIWISEDDFLRTYTTESVYYPARVGDVLVPDTRWLPKLGLTTALARAALSPPSAWLKNAVTTPFPTGADLQVDSVPVSHAGIADISLTNKALAASSTQKTAIWAVLSATLDQDPSVSGVNVTVHGRRLETDNLPTSVHAPSDVGFALPPKAVSSVMVRTGRFSAWADANAAQSGEGIAAQSAKSLAKLPAIPPDWSLVAAGQGGQQIAAVSADHTALRRWVSGAQLDTTSIGQGLKQPSFDAQGWLWAVGAAPNQPHVPVRSSTTRTSAASADGSAPGNGLWVIDTSTTSTRVASPLAVAWLKNVVSLSLSPEGDRLALIVKNGGQTQLMLAAVIRNASGAPVALGAPTTLPIAVTAMKSVVWADAVSVVVLGTFEGQKQPAIVTMDGDVSGLGALPGADAITSTWNGADGLFVHSENGTVYNRLGSAWNSYMTKGEVIVPGS